MNATLGLLVSVLCSGSNQLDVITSAIKCPRLFSILRCVRHFSTAAVLLTCCCRLYLSVVVALWLASALCLPRNVVG